MKLPSQARPVARLASHQRIGGGISPSDCCGGGECCLGMCAFGKCLGKCVPNIGQC